MRKIVLILAVAATNLLLPSKSKGQSVYIITEVFRNTPPLYDSIYVTTPTGSVTGYSIPHLSNVSGHDSALSTIINGVSTLGYTISDYSVIRSLPGTLSITMQRWFLKKP
jgi:hypothetical protein